MMKAWRERRIWIAALIAFFAPPIAFLFLSRWKAAIFVFFIKFIILIGVLLVVAPIIGYKSGATVASFFVNFIFVGYILFFIKSRKDGRKWFSHLWFLVLISGLFYLSVFGFRTFIARPIITPSVSMAPILTRDDVSIASALKRPLGRGCVIVYKKPMDDNHFVGRVIALEGEQIEIKDGTIMINGSPILQKQITPPYISVPQSPIPYDVYEESGWIILDKKGFGRYDELPLQIIPDGYVFVMGDFRDNSRDSREFGPIPIADVVEFGYRKIFDGINKKWQWKPLDEFCN